MRAIRSKSSPALVPTRARSSTMTALAPALAARAAIERRGLAGPDAVARDDRLPVAQVEAERHAVAADGLADVLQRFERRQGFETDHDVRGASIEGVTARGRQTRYRRPARMACRARRWRRSPRPAARPPGSRRDRRRTARSDRRGSHRSAPASARRHRRLLRRRIAPADTPPAGPLARARRVPPADRRRRLSATGPFSELVNRARSAISYRLSASALPI